jgi:hypothetical protein
MNPAKMHSAALPPYPLRNDWTFGQRLCEGI